MKVGNGLWEKAKFNDRLQVTEFGLGNSAENMNRWKINLEYGELDANGNIDTTKNTGNLAKQTISFEGLAQPFIQTYKYDSLYRITQAKETNNGTQTWIQNFGYDRYGNRTNLSQTINGNQIANNNITHPTINPNTNRFNAGQGYQYDKVGNLIADAENRTFTFDGNNKQKFITDSNSNTVGEYFYDGNGKRIKKKVYANGQHLETVIFVYSGGKLVAEYSTKPPPTNPSTKYVATDHLQSVRAISNQNGEIVSRRDFLPFGEELPADTNLRKPEYKYAGTEDNVRQKFTGYQKDEETGLDFAEARMYQNKHARFTAVDPLLASGKSANPQTFNRFVYVMNSPLIFTDPTGLQVSSTFDPTINTDEIVAVIQERACEFFGFGCRFNPPPTQFDYNRDRPNAVTNNILNRISSSDPLQNLNYGRFQNRLNATAGDPDAANALNNRLVGNKGPSVDSVIQTTTDSYKLAETIGNTGIALTNLTTGASGLVRSGSSTVTTNRGLSVSPNAFTPAPIGKVQGLKRVNDIRTETNAGRLRNIAFAEFEIDGVQGEMTAVSGQALRPGTVSLPENSVFNPTFPGKQFDSEVKIYENLRLRANPFSTGQVRLFSELEICDSCIGVGNQFQQTFPNIRLITSWGIPNPK